MINELLKNIKEYILYLKKKNLYISIHTDFAEYMQPLLEFNIHDNPTCLLVKSDNDNWEKCIKVHANEEFEQKNTCKKRICYAGVNEYVFRLNCGGTVCVSTKINEKEDMSSEVIKEPEINILIQPLLRMIEYLKAICPETNFDITQSELVNRAIKFIQRNFYNPISNRDIAKACSCSESSLCHLFKKHKGKSIRRYILDLRLSYSEKLLKSSNISIASIAYKAGFSDYNYFAYKFKKETGVTASEYRKIKKDI